MLVDEALVESVDFTDVFKLVDELELSLLLTRLKVEANLRPRCRR